MNLKKVFTNIIDNFLKKSFIKNVLTLMTGTIIAQIISFLLMPILTRIYFPEDFGVYALFLSFSSVLSIIIAGSYEYAIILPKDRIEATNLLVLCIGLSGIISLGIFILFIFMGQELLSYIRRPDLFLYLLLTPIYMWGLSINQAFYYWFNRESLFSIMSKSRLLLVISNNFLGIVIGANILGSPIGLVLGNILGQIITNIYIINKFISYISINKELISINKLILQAKRYKNFPRFSMPGNVINNISQQLPIFLMGFFYGENVVGYFSMGQRCINAPLSVLSQSIGDVFREKASKQYASNGECKLLFDKLIKVLVLLSIVPLITLLIFAPDLFAIYFGVEWREAGIYTQILVPMYFLKVIASPLSNMSIIAEKQRIDLLFQILIIIVLSLFIYLSKVIWDTAIYTVVSFGVGYIIIYFTSLCINRNWAKGVKK